MNDRDAIVDTCTRLSWYIDRGEWDKVVPLLSDPVLVDYTSVNGGEPESYHPSDLVVGLAAHLDAMDATQHVQANHLVRVDGESAVCTANVLGFHRLSNPFGSPMRVIGGIYRFELDRTVDRWTIRSWTFDLSWADGNQGIMALAAASSNADSVDQ